METSQELKIKHYLVAFPASFWRLVDRRIEDKGVIEKGGCINKEKEFDELNNIIEEKKWKIEKFNHQTEITATVLPRLLDERLGVKRLVVEFIAPETKKHFKDRPKTDDGLNYLRKAWIAGQRPDPKTLVLDNIMDPSPFVSIVNYKLKKDGKYVNYTEGWQSFAGLWFEEIEKMPEVRELLGLK